MVEGTFENCAGGVTPWGTALSCEENIQARVPEEVDTRGRFRRGGSFDLPGGHYGWVVEVDPHDPTSIPVKHTALGRFRHEGVGLRAVPGQPLAGYMGDDRIGGHVWKFVSAGLYQPGRPESRALFSEGTLYAARFEEGGTGEWRPILMDTPLDPAPSPRDPKPPIPAGARRLGDVYETLGAALMDAYRAANAVGGTPSGRPEDVEVHPADGSVFIAFTASSDRPGLWPNIYGEVWRLEEDGGDPRARSFRWSRFSVGGPSDPARTGHVFSQPDNLVFDRRGDLWVATDLAGEHVNVPGLYTAFKNSRRLPHPRHRARPRQALAACLPALRVGGDRSRLRSRGERAVPVRPASGRAVRHALLVLRGAPGQQLALAPGGYAAPARGRGHAASVNRVRSRHASCKACGRGAAR